MLVNWSSKNRKYLRNAQNQQQILHPTVFSPHPSPPIPTSLSFTQPNGLYTTRRHLIPQAFLFSSQIGILYYYKLSIALSLLVFLFNKSIMFSDSTILIHTHCLSVCPYLFYFVCMLFRGSLHTSHLS